MKLIVRIAPRKPGEKFRRCGLEFGRDWKAVDVDDATAARLRAEQMLEVAAPESTPEQPETPEVEPAPAPEVDPAPEPEPARPKKAKK
ncbi:MAG: hypothetical protein LBU45_04915 [Azoarcus sp.]|jgi:hypothetical protein|nr:hypothetical protein [Azoarcus sp.]